MLVRLVRQQTAAVDFTTSNVRGAPFPLYIAGARVLANHPIGPLGGTAWNLTTLSVDGSLDMGLHIDTGAVDDPVLLRPVHRRAPSTSCWPWPDGRGDAALRPGGRPRARACWST